MLKRVLRPFPLVRNCFENSSVRYVSPVTELDVLQGDFSVCAQKKRKEKRKMSIFILFLIHFFFWSRHFNKEYNYWVETAEG